MKIHNNCIRLDSSILRKIGYITIYLYIICITMVGCGPGARPPAEKPIFVSSGALITESGVTRELGKLEEHTGWWGNHINNFYVDNVIASSSAYSMSFYVTIRYPWLTKLKAFYNSAAITWVDPPDTQFISYTVGPRPYPELENAVSNGENIMWVHGNVNLNVSSPDVTFAIVIGAGNPVDLSALEFWTESSNPDYSGTQQAVSDRLSLVLTRRGSERFEANLYRVPRNGRIDLNWDIARAERIWISKYNSSKVEVSHPSGTISFWAPSTRNSIFYTLDAKVIGSDAHWYDTIQIGVF